MAVYVDDIFMWPIDMVENAQVRRLAEKNGGQWSHMIADTEQELVAFALKIGLRREWIQHSGTPRVHFDLTPGRRVVAVKRGAIYLEGLDFYRKWDELKEKIHQLKLAI